MFFILSKLLSFALVPLFWIGALLLWSIFSKNEKKKRKLLIISVVALLFFSNRIIADRVMELWELPFSEKNYHKNYDVAIVLGGLSSYSPVSKHIEWREGSDRLQYPLEMYGQKKVKKILISGGSGSLAAPDKREALFLKQFLLDVGVRSQDIIIEKNSRNTHENAVFSKQILDSLGLSDTKILLVTSSYHMRRARACFKKEDLNFDILPVDFTAGTSIYYADQYIIPDGEALKIWNTLLKELVGYMVYSIKGFV